MQTKPAEEGISLRSNQALMAHDERHTPCHSFLEKYSKTAKAATKAKRASLRPIGNCWVCRWNWFVRTPRRQKFIR
jgi:hypothetical protein